MEERRAEERTRMPAEPAAQPGTISGDARELRREMHASGREPNADGPEPAANGDASAAAVREEPAAMSSEEMRQVECPLCDPPEYMHAHEALVASVNESMPDEEMLYDLAELYKVFGDSTRIKILYVLFEAEMCVCDIAQLLGMTQSAISHQLRVLKANKLVKFRRDGKTVFYSLADNHVRTIIDMGMEHLCE